MSESGSLVVLRGGGEGECNLYANSPAPLKFVQCLKAECITMNDFRINLYY